MTPCDKCKYRKECRSLSDFELTCEEVERIATDYYTKAKQVVKDGEQHGKDNQKRTCNTI